MESLFSLWRAEEMAPCQLFSEYPGGLWQWYNREQHEPLQSQEESSDATVQSQELLS